MGDSPLGARLFDGVDVASLAPDEEVQLDVASRQFQRALDTYEVRDWAMDNLHGAVVALQNASRYIGAREDE